MIKNWLSGNPKKQKQEELWRGIVRKAQADQDFSLDDISLTDDDSAAEGNSMIRVIPMYRKTWVAVAAMILISLSTSLWFYLSNANHTLNEGQLTEVFADGKSVSRLLLSNGDTVLLDGPQSDQESITDLLGDDQSIDFRKLAGLELENGKQKLETGRGKQLAVTLADGTRVWLNASSKLEFPGHFDGKLREVSVQGEAYFEVAHNKEKPFVVKTSNNQVKVLGTHFNVKDYKGEDREEVTLLEGAVEVSGKEFQPLFLKPSEQFVKEGGRNKPSVEILNNPETVIAWKSGDFYFQDATAENIVKELERWYPVEITIIKQDNSKKISGKIKRGDSMKAVVDMLRFFDIEISIAKSEN